MATYKLSQNCKAYLGTTLAADKTNAAHATAISAATVIGKVKDLTISQTRGKTDVTTRDSGGEVQQAPGLRDRTITFDFIGLTSDAAFDVLDDAYHSDTAYEVFFAALDDAGTVTGARGIAGNFFVSKWDRSEKNGEAVTYSVELTPSSFTGSYTKGA